MTQQSFKALRINRGWSAARLAREVGVSRQSVHDWDKGAVPRPEVAVKVAKLLGFDMATDIWPVEPVERPGFPKAAA